MGGAVLTAALVLVLGLAASICSAEEVPAFIWGDLEYKSLLANPLERTTAEEFESSLREELKSQPLLVAFVEETLSVEDLSRRDAAGSTSLPYLRSNLQHSVYLPAVQTPVSALGKVAGADLTDRIRLTESGLSAEIGPDTSVVIIELADARAGESRAQLLRRHDQFMSETVAKLKKQHGGVVALYTAYYPSWSLPEDYEHSTRSRRHLLQQAVVAEEPAVVVYNLTYMLIKFGAITISKQGSAPVNVTVPVTGPTVEANTTTGIVTVSFTNAGYKVSLYFHNGGNSGYWNINQAEVTETSSNTLEQLSTATVHVLSDFSFHCGPGVTFSGNNATYTLTIKDFQAQPFFDGTANIFGDAIDCVGFTTVPIWSGLFVLTILLAIFFYGVCSMMDIRTMDRFDDAKGKTITINATE